MNVIIEVIPHLRCASVLLNWTGLWVCGSCGSAGLGSCETEKLLWCMTTRGQGAAMPEC
jgi:hypothetical protein